MDSKRVLFISQEIHPYLPENTISSTTLELAKKTNASGHQVRVFMPRFGVINERRHQLHEVIRLSGMNVVINDMDLPLIIMLILHHQYDVILIFWSIVYYKLI